MVRILQLPGNLNRSNGRMTVIMNIYKQLQKLGFQFDFLATLTSEDNYIEEIIKLGGHVFYLNEDQVTLVNVRKRMKTILSETKYDIVHYHAISEWGITIDIPHKRGIKVITHSHATEFSDSLFKSIRNRIFSLNIFSNSDMFAACSQEAGRHFFGRHSFIYLPNAIDTSAFIFQEDKRILLRNQLGILPEQLVIGNVGRLSKQKNQFFLLKVLNFMIKQGVDAKLLVIGDGPLKAELKKEIEKLKLESSVLLPGFVTSPADYYSVMDVFALPSLFEGLPMVGVEAQSNGLPAIFSDKVSQTVNLYNANFLKINEESTALWAEKFMLFWKKGRDNCAPEHVMQKKFDSNTGSLIWKKLYDAVNI